MNKIRTILVDDEPLALNLLRSYLNQHQEIEIVADCNNGREAIAMVNQHQPDLMFLDIQMPGLSGFDVIQKLQADTLPLIVFITAYDQYALEAFDVHAVDYLLKPLDRNALSRAISRCQDRLNQHELDINNKSQIIEAIKGIGMDKIASSISDSQGYCKKE